MGKGREVFSSLVKRATIFNVGQRQRRDSSLGLLYPTSAASIRLLYWLYTKRPLQFWFYFIGKNKGTLFEIL